MQNNQLPPKGHVELEDDSIAHGLSQLIQAKGYYNLFYT